MGSKNNKRQQQQQQSQKNAQKGHQKGAKTSAAAPMNTSVKLGLDRERADGTGCPHLGRGVAFGNLHISTSTVLHCKNCYLYSTKGKVKQSPTDLWVCLQCGHLGCGRACPERHAVTHNERCRSHTIVVNAGTFEPWCYECDRSLEPDEESSVMVCIRHLKQCFSKEPVETRSSAVVKVSSNGAVPGIPVKGLSNLGNTCFFNSIVQCLNQVTLFRLRINNLRATGATVTVSPDDQDPISVVLKEEEGRLVVAVKSLLADIGSEPARKGAVNPKAVLSQVQHVAPQFHGFRQHDSQELLRALLDGIRAEESKRVKRAVLQQMNLGNGNVKTGTVSPQTRAAIRAYGKAADHSTFIDDVFGGTISSTVACLSCGKTSSTAENFLDLSLPLPEEAPVRGSAHAPAAQKGTGKGSKKFVTPGNGNSDSVAETAQSSSATPKLSKHQFKKEQRLQKKEAKRKNKQLPNRDTASHSVSSQVETTSSEAGEVGASNDALETSRGNSEDTAEKPESGILNSLSSLTTEASSGVGERGSSDPGSADATDVQSSSRDALPSGRDSCQGNDSGLPSDQSPSPGGKDSPRCADDLPTHTPALSPGSCERELSKVNLSLDAEQAKQRPVPGEPSTGDESSSFALFERSKSHDKQPVGSSDCAEEEEEEDEEETGNRLGDASTAPGSTMTCGELINCTLSSYSDRSSMSSGRLASNTGSDDCQSSTASSAGRFSSPSDRAATDTGSEGCSSGRIASNASLDVSQSSTTTGRYGNPAYRAAADTGSEGWPSDFSTTDSGSDGWPVTTASPSPSAAVNKHDSTSNSAAPSPSGSKQCTASQQYADPTPANAQPTLLQQVVDLDGFGRVTPLAGCGDPWSLEACLHRFVQPELLDGANRFKCKECGRQKALSEQDTSQDNKSVTSKDVVPEEEEDDDEEGEESAPGVYSPASKQLLLQSLPPVLTFHLKRFRLTHKGRSEKISRHVKFPLVVDMTPFCQDTQGSAGTQTDSSMVYSLFAVAEHSGGTGSGHHVAFVKSRMPMAACAADRQSPGDATANGKTHQDARRPGPPASAKPVNPAVPVATSSGGKPSTSPAAAASGTSADAEKRPLDAGAVADTGVASHGHAQPVSARERPNSNGVSSPVTSPTTPIAPDQLVAAEPCTASRATDSDSVNGELTSADTSADTPAIACNSRIGREAGVRVPAADNGAADNNINHGGSQLKIEQDADNSTVEPVPSTDDTDAAADKSQTTENRSAGVENGAPNTSAAAPQIPPPDNPENHWSWAAAAASGLSSMNHRQPVDAPPGTWYYCSDAQVRPTTVQEVLTSQAYVLFYEQLPLRPASAQGPPYSPAAA